MISFSATLRIMYSFRSKSIWLFISGDFPMNTWIIRGRMDLAASPMMLSSMGTSRHPSTDCPSALTIFSKASICFLRKDSYRWAKIMPTPYSPASGKEKPRTSHSRTKNSWGICTRMPAPSPLFWSAPSAPRWFRFSKIFSASSMMP